MDGSNGVAGGVLNDGRIGTMDFASGTNATHNSQHPNIGSTGFNAGMNGINGFGSMDGQF